MARLEPSCQNCDFICIGPYQPDADCLAFMDAETKKAFSVYWSDASGQPYEPLAPTIIIQLADVPEKP